MNNFSRKQKLFLLTAVFVTAAISFSIGGAFMNFRQPVIADNLRLDDQEATIRAIKKVSPAVVSIAVYGTDKISSIDLKTGESTTAKEKRKQGSGTGFLISADGLIITNKHVAEVAKADGEFRITLNSGKQYYAQLIGKDPLNDLALLKIFDKNLPFVELGDSDKLQPGVTAIAIGNALGIYEGSVTKGIVSGLNRNIVASDQAGNAEQLGNVIQTDAEINPGNSGGPLIDLEGKVIGVNVAIDSAATSIGFAIPINDVKPVIKSAREIGRIVRPRLGIRYQMLTDELAKENKLPRARGAWITGGQDDASAITPDSPAAKAGLLAGDIIFEINGVKIDGTNTLLSIVQRFKPGTKIGLKIQRGNKIFTKTVELDEFKDN